MTTGTAIIAILFVESLLVVPSCGETPPAGRSIQMKPLVAVPKIPQQEAVSIAETFVINNGYTDVMPAKTGQISVEGIDSSDSSRRLSDRFNTLRRHACGTIGRNIWSRREGWTVVFCFNKENFEKLQVYPKLAPMLETHGRPVVMEPDGSGIRVLHEDVLLNHPEMKRLN